MGEFLMKDYIDSFSFISSAYRKNGFLFFARNGCFKLLFFFIICFWSSEVLASPQNSKGGDLVLGVRFDAPPFSSCDKDLTSCTGYSVSLCKKIAQMAIKEGVACSYSIKKVSVSDRFTALKTGDIDMLCGASTVTLERMRVADFSLFTFLSGITVMYNSSSVGGGNVKNESVPIGMLHNTTTKEQIGTIWSDIRSKLGYEKNHTHEIQIAATHDEGLEWLLSGKIRFYIADREILMALKRNAGEQGKFLKVSSTYFSIEPYALGIRAGANNLRFLANKVLSELFAKDEKSKKPGIIRELKIHFPDSRFSRSLQDMYLTQRLKIGIPIAPPMEKQQCSEH